jgi:hypothetical protein
VDGITVVWIATNPETGGRFVVGWYRKARVFRKRQQSDTYPSKQHKRDKRKTYSVIAAASQVVRLLPDQRRAFSLGNAWMGQKQWWYPHLHVKTHPDVAPFLRRLAKRINKVSNDPAVLLNEELATRGDTDELIKIKDSKTLTRTQKKQLIEPRIGQGSFRKSLDKEWNSRCCNGMPDPRTAAGISYQVMEHFEQ